MSFAIQASLDAVRETIRGLRASPIGARGLSAALRALISRMDAPKPIRADIQDVHGLPETSQLAIYQIAREALTNAIRYSRGGRIQLQLRRTELGYLLKIQDDGIGFDPSQEKGLGLLGMEERVARLGGRFRMDSQPGRGALLTIHFPLENA